MKYQNYDGFCVNPQIKLTAEHPSPLEKKKTIIIFLCFCNNQMSLSLPMSKYSEVL